MSSFPPPPPPPPPPIDPPPPVTPKRSGVPPWVWVVGVVALLGGGAVAAFALGGDDKDKPASATTAAGSATTIDTPGSEPDSTEVTDTTPNTDTTPGTTPGGVPAGIGGTRDAPVPVGQVADIGGDWRLQVLDVIPDASAMMAADDEFFQPAPAGFTYMLVKVALGYFGTEDPKVGFEPDLAVLGTSSVTLDNFCLSTVPDEVDFFNYLFSGGVVVGNACYIAPVGEAGSFVMYGRGDFFDEEGEYLALDTPTAAVQPMAALLGPQPGAQSTPARLAPAPLGTTTAVGPDWQVTVTGAARDITAEVLAANEFNDPPPAGFRYVGVDMTFAYSGAGGASPAQVSIGAVGSDNVQHDGYCGIVPGELDRFTDLFAGGSASGTMCVVLPDDGGAVALFATADFNGFIWFATN